MNIDVQILIDGEPAKVNADLQELVSNLVSSYIKQKFIVGRSTQAKLPKVKDPNAVPRAPRPKVTEEEYAAMMRRAFQLTNITMGKAVNIISEEMKRSPNTIYLRLREEMRKGNIHFAEYVKNQ